MKMRIWFILLLLVSLVAAAPPKARRSRIHGPVWSESSKPLKASEMVATLGGEPAEIVRLRGPDDGLMILLVLDLVEDLVEQPDETVERTEYRVEDVEPQDRGRHPAHDTRDVKRGAENRDAADLLV